MQVTDIAYGNRQAAIEKGEFKYLPRDEVKEWLQMHMDIVAAQQL